MLTTPTFPRLVSAGLLLAALAAAPVFAQEPVVGTPNPESLFTSKDKKLNINKQATLHIMKDLLEANHWDEANKWITDRYLQHNPNVKSGLANVVAFFTATRKPTPVPEHMKTEIVTVTAEGDYVIVVTPRRLPDPRDPSKTYTTTWFDMWRFVGGKADEHWDGATIAPPNPNGKGR